MFFTQDLSLLKEIVIFVPDFKNNMMDANCAIKFITGTLLCIVLPLSCFAILFLTGKLVSLVWQPAAKVGCYSGIAIGVILFIAMLYGSVFGWRHLKVKHVDLYFEELPAAFEGYRIAHLSDLHVGSYSEKSGFIQKMVDQVNNEQPDLIVFTGDMVNMSSDESKPFETLLSTLQAPDGVIAVLGNHDYSLYGLKRHQANPRKEAAAVVQSERRMGWEVLLNEHRTIYRNGTQIAIVGVENTGKPPFPEIGDLKGAMEGIPEGTFKILLSHDPSHWRMEVLPETDIPLTLSGHTHAGQFKVANWSLVRWLYPEWGGLYTEGRQSLYVSEGLGGTIPFRLGSSPEIILLTLHQK